MPTKQKTAARGKRATAQKRGVHVALVGSTKLGKTSVRSVRVNVRPQVAEFVDAAGNVLERLPNGSRNSDAFVNLGKRLISERENGAALSLRFFDTAGNEIVDAEQFAALTAR